MKLVSENWAVGGESSKQRSHSTVSQDGNDIQEDAVIARKNKLSMKTVLPSFLMIIV